MKTKLLIILTLLTIILTACASSDAPKASPKPLSEAQKTRVKQIVTIVIQDKAQPTAAIHDEFWGIMDQLGSPSGDDLAVVRETFAGPTVDYMKLFYEDAKVALARGAAFKSEDRTALEQRLLEQGLVSDARIAQNDAIIDKIAHKQPVQVGNQSYVLNATQLQQIIDGLEATRGRLDKLFTP
jgi:hypothetical protein